MWPFKEKKEPLVIKYVQEPRTVDVELGVYQPVITLTSGKEFKLALIKDRVSDGIYNSYCKYHGSIYFIKRSSREAMRQCCLEKSFLSRDTYPSAIKANFVINSTNGIYKFKHEDICYEIPSDKVDQVTFSKIGTEIQTVNFDVVKEIK